MKEENPSTIYGLKINDKFFYIGKTSKEFKNDTIPKSKLTVIYSNEKIKKSFINTTVEIVPLKFINNNWYDEKLLEVVKKHNENNNLINAKWMLEGKRGYYHGTLGYWKNKKRDVNTINKLNESKYKKVLQYDNNGTLIKIWTNRRDVAIQIFKDYKFVNGNTRTGFYSFLRNKYTKNRFFNNSYWFTPEEIFKKFNEIPKSLNINDIILQEEKNKLKNKVNILIKNFPYHTIIQYNDDGTIKNIYDNRYAAAIALNISHHYVTRLCNPKSNSKHKKYNIKYGEKKLQQLIKK